MMICLRHLRSGQGIREFTGARLNLYRVSMLWERVRSFTTSGGSATFSRAQVVDLCSIQQRALAMVQASSLLPIRGVIQPRRRPSSILQMVSRRGEDAFNQRLRPEQSA